MYQSSPESEFLLSRSGIKTRSCQLGSGAFKFRFLELSRYAVLKGAVVSSRWHNGVGSFGSLSGFFALSPYANELHGTRIPSVCPVLRLGGAWKGGEGPFIGTAPPGTFEDANGRPLGSSSAVVVAAPLLIGSQLIGSQLVDLWARRRAAPSSVAPGSSFYPSHS